MIPSYTYHHIRPAVWKHSNVSDTKSVRANTEESSVDDKPNISPLETASGRKRKKASNVVQSSDSESESKPPKKKTATKTSDTQKFISKDDKPSLTKVSPIKQSSKTIARDGFCLIGSGEYEDGNRPEGEEKKKNKSTEKRGTRETQTKKNQTKKERIVEVEKVKSKPKYSRCLHIP